MRSATHVPIACNDCYGWNLANLVETRTNSPKPKNGRRFVARRAFLITDLGLDTTWVHHGFVPVSSYTATLGLITGYF